MITSFSSLVAIFCLNRYTKQVSAVVSSKLLIFTAHSSLLSLASCRLRTGSWWLPLLLFALVNHLTIFPPFFSLSFSRLRSSSAVLPTAAVAAAATGTTRSRRPSTRTTTPQCTPCPALAMPNRRTSTCPPAWRPSTSTSSRSQAQCTSSSSTTAWAAATR